mgnify:CR=1 FL=1
MIRIFVLLLAALLAGKIDVSGKVVVAVLSGGNVDLGEVGRWF